MPELIKLDNPLRKYERQYITIAPGRSVQDILDEYYKDDDVLTFINSETILPEQRISRIIRDNEYLLVVPKVAGDDAGKQILNIALMVGLFYVAGWAGANYYFAPLGVGLGTAVLQIGIVVGGAMLISALQPSPKMPSSGFIDDEQSQSFGWNPVTVQRQGIAEPRAYGLNKIFGNVIAAHTEKESVTTNITTITETLYYWSGFGKRIYSQTVQRTQTDIFDPRKVNLNALFCLGVGPMREPVVSGTLQLNDQPVENLSNVNYEYRYGDILQQEISYFSNTKLEVVVNRTVVNGTPITYTTTNANFDDLEIEVSFPKGLFDGSGADLANNTVNVTIDIKKTTSSTWTTIVNNAAITNNIADKVIQTYTASTQGFTVEYGYNYDIRVTKETAERDSVRYGDQLLLDKVREIIQHQFTYPRTALVGINAQATDQLSGSIRFSCYSRGLYVRSYNGASWVIEYSNNPAWVIYDILTQPVFTGAHSPWLDLKLMLNFEGDDASTITVDDSPKGNDITFGGSAEIDTASFVFGLSSLSLDGVDSFISTTNTENIFGIWNNTVENWTIDLYVYMRDHTGTEYIYAQYVDANNYWYLKHVDASGFALYVYVGGAALIDISGVGEIAGAGSYHIAVCKVGDDIGIYKSGTQIGYDQLTTDDNYTFKDSTFYIGQDGNSGNYLYAWIDHFRIIQSNIFSAAPVVGLTDTITEPAAAYSDPGNTYAVSRYDGYDPSKLLTADFEDLADWCDDAETNPQNFTIDSISQATNAVIVTRSSHNFKVGDTILFRNIDHNGMTDISDGDTATVTKITDNTTITVDLNTSGFNAFTIGDRLICNFEGNDGDISINGESLDPHSFIFADQARIESDAAKWGNTSAYFTGTVTDHAYSTDSTDWDVLETTTTVVSIDFWVKHDDHAGDETYIAQYEDVNNYWEIHHSDGNGLRFTNVSGGVAKIQTPYGGEITNTEWRHVAMIKNGTEIGVYLDGTQVGYDQMVAGDADTYTGQLNIGARQSSTNNYAGYMDGLRINYTNHFGASPVVGLGDTITVPTAAPSIIGTATIERYQPRFQFNGIFDTETTMWEAALSVCELCRCIPFWDGDKIRIAIDKAGSSVYAFTMGNIIRDTFKQKFIPTSERASEIEVHYRDASRDYERTPFTLINSSLSNTTAKVRLDMFGITDSDMANRLADFKLLQNLYLKELVLFQSDIESLSLVIGDIFDFQHDVTNYGQIGSGSDSYTGGGRIISATNTTNAVITIGGNIILADADFAGGSTTYSLLITPVTDAAPESKVITGITESSLIGGSYDITVSGTYAVKPQRHDVWAAGQQNLETKKYRVINIRRTEDNKAEITGIEYRTEVYAND